MVYVIIQVQEGEKAPAAIQATHNTSPYWRSSSFWKKKRSFDEI